jgi:hypothetical protein
LVVSGDWNAWSTSDQTASLSWDGARYHGVVTLPGDRLSLRLYATATGQLVGQAPSGGALGSDPAAGMAALPPAPVPTAVGTVTAPTAEPLQFFTPLPTIYSLDFMPATGELHIDLAVDAEMGLAAEAAALVSAPRQPPGRRPGSVELGCLRPRLRRVGDAPAAAASADAERRSGAA